MCAIPATPRREEGEEREGFAQDGQEDNGGLGGTGELLC